jgi:fatty acid desaturase
MTEVAKSKPTPEQTRKFGRILMGFAVVEAVLILGLSFWLQVPWMPLVALVSLPTFIWGLMELRKANAAEAPR